MTMTRTRAEALEAVAAAAREMMACKRGFHADHEEIYAARKELREALAALDASGSGSDEWRRDRSSTHWVRFSPDGPWQISHWIVPAGGKRGYWSSYLNPVEIGPALPRPPSTRTREEERNDPH